MEQSSFFNSVSGDRRYKAEDWADYFASFIGNGVFPNPSTNLQVLANNSMTVTVSVGKAWINGYFYHNTEALPLTLATADGQLKRIDRIVLRWDAQERNISVQVKQGSYSSSPTVQAVQRDADAYEIVLADIDVGAGVLAIQQGNVTDQRLDSDLCGLVVGTVTELDTTTFNAQLQGWFDTYRDKSATQYKTLENYMSGLKLQSSNDYKALTQWFAAFETDAEAEFRAWFNDLQDVLDENTATNLYHKIQLLTNRVELLEQMAFTDLNGTPYIITFDSLDGVNLNGVWNETLHCISC